MKMCIILSLFLVSTVGIAQTQNVTPLSKPAEKGEPYRSYDPMTNAKIDIQTAVARAQKEGKHVLIQIGGNWCSWCKLFDDKIKANDTLRTAMEKGFVPYHLNYSPENFNKEILASFGYPQRFGFPVFVILDGKGNRIHTENSAYLEEGHGHSTKKVLEFFSLWSPGAIDPQNYR